LKIGFQALATSRKSSHTNFWVSGKYRIAGADFDISIMLNHINPVPTKSSLMTAELLSRRETNIIKHKKQVQMGLKERICPDY